MSCLLMYHLIYKTSSDSIFRKFLTFPSKSSHVLPLDDALRLAAARLTYHRSFGRSTVRLKGIAQRQAGSSNFDAVFVICQPAIPCIDTFFIRACMRARLTCARACVFINIYSTRSVAGQQALREKTFAYVPVVNRSHLRPISRTERSDSRNSRRSAYQRNGGRSTVRLKGVEHRQAVERDSIYSYMLKIFEKSKGFGETLFPRYLLVIL